jgi:glycosyltransferase involved in cell wall biosynthesis
MNTLVSIIIPIFNTSRYLDKCLKSIINQTFKNLEIILINDGSTDDSLLICEKYQKTDSRIIILNKTNEGAASARNLGLDFASGEYIGFIDSDDFVHPKMYEKLVDISKKYNTDIAFCNFHEGNINQKKINQDYDIFEINKFDLLNDMYTSKATSAVVVWNKLFKKHLFNNIRYPKNHIIDDEAIIYKLIFFSSKVYYTSEKLYYYTYNPSSITKTKYFNPKKILFLESLHEKALFFKDKNASLYKKTLIYLLDYIFFIFSQFYKNNVTGIKNYYMVKKIYLSNVFGFINIKEFIFYKKFLLILSLINYEILFIGYFFYYKIKYRRSSF